MVLSGLRHSLTSHCNTLNTEFIEFIQYGAVAALHYSRAQAIYIRTGNLILAILL